METFKSIAVIIFDSYHCALEVTLYGKRGDCSHVESITPLDTQFSLKNTHYKKIIFVEGEGDLFDVPGTRLTVDVPLFLKGGLRGEVSRTAHPDHGTSYTNEQGEIIRVMSAKAYGNNKQINNLIVGFSRMTTTEARDAMKKSREVSEHNDYKERDKQRIAQNQRKFASGNDKFEGNYNHKRREENRNEV